MKKQLSMLLGTALFTVVVISSAKADLSDSFCDAPILSAQEIRKVLVTKDTVCYDSDSDDEGEIVVKQISRQNSQEDLTKSDEVPSVKKTTVASRFEAFTSAVSTFVQVIKSVFGSWFN